MNRAIAHFRGFPRVAVICFGPLLGRIGLRHHSELVCHGLIVPFGSAVIVPVAIALRTAASETPRCAA